MSSVREGDTFVDVGSYRGIYAVAVAKRVGKRGKVFALEPDPTNFSQIKHHVLLNNVRNVVEVLNAAASDIDGTLSFGANASCEGKVCQSGSADSTIVPAIRLDTILDGIKVDVMKIDAEGFEETILRGAQLLLTDPSRAPRAIYVEVHPFAWPEFGGSSATLLKLLDDCGYDVRTLDAEMIELISEYGNLVAIRR